MKNILCLALSFFLFPTLSAQTKFEDFEHGRAQVNGVNIHYRIAGKGKSVLLIHGWPQHSLMWHKIAPKLVDAGYQVICPDLRGTGSSSLPQNGYDKKTMAEDIWQLTQELDLERFYVVGYDLGSGVAFNMAARHPGNIEKIVVMEFGLPGFGYEQIMAPTPEWDNGSNWHLGLFTLPDVAMMAFDGKERELLSWFFWHIAYDGSAVSQEHFNAYLRYLQRPGALRAGIMYYASVWQDSEDNTSIVEKNGKLKMPMLAVGGEASSGAYVSLLFQDVAENITTLVVPNAGHWLGDENPNFLADELAKFLRE